jgi:hypothetical protein
MTRANLVTTGLLVVFLVAGMSFTASAGFQKCFPINGQNICFDVPVETVEFKIPRWPEEVPPPNWVDIATLTTLLQEVLGDTSTTWYMGDETGQHTFLLDLEAGQAVDLQDLPSPGFE